MHLDRPSLRLAGRLSLSIVAAIVGLAAATPASAGDDDPFSIAVGYDVPTAYWRLSDLP